MSTTQKEVFFQNIRVLPRMTMLKASLPSFTRFLVQFLTSKSSLMNFLNEFSKRIDPECPFYYWTGFHTLFQDFPLPSFNEPSSKSGTERLDRVILSRRSDPGLSVPNRPSIPQKGQLTTRAQYHKAPVQLPPLLND